MSNYRRRLMQIRKGGILPSEYQQVEYIESTGAQYIDTGVIPKENQKIELKTYYEAAAKNSVILGSRTSGSYSTSKNQIYFNDTASRKLFLYLGTSGNIITDTRIDGMLDIILDISNKTLTNKLDDSTVDLSSNFDNQATYSYYLFSISNKGSPTAYASAKVYNFKFYDNDILEKEFIPCYRKSDNEIGMYDLVEDIFYTNAGTGTFLKGDDV